jgi:hypothetical protein
LRGKCGFKCHLDLERLEDSEVPELMDGARSGSTDEPAPKVDPEWRAYTNTSGATP